MKHIADIMLGASLLLLTSCHSHSSADDELRHHHHHHNHAHAGHAAENHTDDSEKTDGDEIVLAPEMAGRFGVATDTVRPAPMAVTIRATGTVLDAPGGSAVVSAPAAGMVRFAAGVAPGARLRAGALVATIDSRGVVGGDAGAAAKAALDAAQRELARLEPLHAERLVTDDVYNAALAACESARAAYSSRADGGRAATPIAGTIISVDVAQGQYVEAGAPLAAVSAAERLVLRVDVAERMRSRLAAVDGVNVRVPGTEQVVALKGRRVVSGPAVSASMPGYVPVYFEFDNDGTIAPGAVVDAWLTEAGSGAPVISLPRTAIAEQQGSHFVYVRLDEDCYRKLPVRLGASDGVRVVVVSGLQGGENVVTSGVTAVRLAETSGVVPEGHSHNH
ncbi:MAG: efflux RND transporter periplasmic adaptor subunit [Muribaculaceae bacterium]|nr:efflux RND transporter periplasmic adaptor subunit [Muribaculaceae bacterium]